VKVTFGNFPQIISVVLPKSMKDSQGRRTPSTSFNRFDKRLGVMVEKKNSSKLICSIGKSLTTF